MSLHTIEASIIFKHSDIEPSVFELRQLFMSRTHRSFE